MDIFVAIRVLVRAGETNRAALVRTLTEGRIRFPLILPTRQPTAASFPAPDWIPDHDWRIGYYDYLVKYEPEVRLA